MHHYFIATKILKENNVICHEHSFYVDKEFVLYSLIHVKTVTFVNLVVYHYWVGRSGQSVSMESQLKNYNQLFNIFNYLIDFYNQNYKSMTANQRRHYEVRLALASKSFYRIFLYYNSYEKKLEMMKFDKDLKARAIKVYNANSQPIIKLLRWSHFILYGVMAQIFRTVRMRKK